MRLLAASLDSHGDEVSGESGSVVEDRSARAGAVLPDPGQAPHNSQQASKESLMASQQPLSPGNLRILTWNINALIPTARNFVLKHGSLRGFFEEQQADIVCFQETKCIDSKLTKDLVCVEGYESFWACSKEKLGYSGVATYARLSHSAVVAEADSLGGGADDIDQEGRVMITDHGAFVLVNVYVPNAGGRPARPRLDYKCRFLAALQTKCAALVASGREVVIVGDLNIAAGPSDVHARLGYDGMYHPDEQAALAGLLASFPDVWRRLHPDATDVYTVWDEKTSARAFNEGLRIDYMLVSPGLLDLVVSCEVLSLPPKWSDHAAMLLELKDVPPPPAHPPCALSSQRMQRFSSGGQRSIASLFGQKRSAPAVAADNDARAAKRSASEGANGRSNGTKETTPAGAGDAIEAAAVPTSTSRNHRDQPAAGVAQAELSTAAANSRQASAAVINNAPEQARQYHTRPAAGAAQKPAESGSARRSNAADAKDCRQRSIRAFMAGSKAT